MKEGQHLQRTIDSEPEEEQDMELEADHDSSDADDSSDGELDRLCRTVGTRDAAIDDTSDSDGEMGGMHTMSLAETSAPVSHGGLMGARCHRRS